MFDALSGASWNERGEGEVKETGSIRLFCFAVVMVALLLAARELQAVGARQVDALQFARPPCVCGGSLLVLRLTPTVQKHVFEANWEL